MARTIRTTIALAALTPSAGVAGAVVSAADSSMAGCRLAADAPAWESYSVLAGEGGRINCITPRTVTVLLRQDRPWLPDRTLAQVRRTGTHVEIVVRRHCTGNAHMKIYTETRTNTGGKVQSGRLHAWC
jgi:hypothetical protein